MQAATLPFINRVAVIFDFDGTLAPDSFEGLLASCGIDKELWEREHVKPRVDEGWDHLLAKMAALIETSGHLKEPITRQRLVKVGEQTDLFDGVPEMFGILRTHAREIIDDIELEYYCVSSGMGEIVRGTPISGEFEAIFACEFAYDDQDAIASVKRVVTHAEKAHYLLQIAKGLGHSGRKSEPHEVYRNVPAEKWHVPLRQVIYAGDGASDQPAFHLLNGSSGIAIGLVKGNSSQDWQYYQDVNAGEQLQNLAPIDYCRDSELMQSLTLGLESICKRMHLNRLGQDDHEASKK